jgi:hypothetical protein
MYWEQEDAAVNAVDYRHAGAQPDAGNTPELVVTAWRLHDPDGEMARCTIGASKGRWQLIVYRGAELFVMEDHLRDDGAFDRALEIWSTLVDQGWTEQLG